YSHSVVLLSFFFFSSRRRHTRFSRDWSSDVCSSDLKPVSQFHRLARRRWLARTPRKTSTRLRPARKRKNLLVGRSRSDRLDRLRSEERRVGKECRARWAPDR